MVHISPAQKREQKGGTASRLDLLSPMPPAWNKVALGNVKRVLLNAWFQEKGSDPLVSDFLKEEGSA